MGKCSIVDLTSSSVIDEPNLDDILAESSSSNDENEEQQPAPAKVEEKKIEKDVGKDS